MTTETVSPDQTDSSERAPSAAPALEPAGTGASLNPSASSRTPSPASNQRNQDRQMISGRARVMATNVVAQNAKIVDANMDGISMLMDLAIKPGGHYTLHLSCFHHGKFLDTQVRAVSIHSTLCGRGFKTGFRFEQLPENVKTDLTNLLRENAK